MDKTISVSDFNAFVAKMAEAFAAAKHEHAPAHFNEAMDALAAVVAESKVKES